MTRRVVSRLVMCAAVCLAPAVVLAQNQTDARTPWGDPDLQGTYTNTYENGTPPNEGTDDFRSWVSNQAAKQDEHYASYNELRDDRNSLDKTARGMTMVALVNHLVSAWDAFALARGFNASLPGATQMKVKFKTSLGNPGASLTFKRHF